jgi:hypothetical protein
MTEKKIKSMVSRASSSKKNAEVTQSIKLLREKRPERIASQTLFIEEVCREVRTLLLPCNSI